MNSRPLAEEIRPTTLDEVIGQTHVIGKNGFLRTVIKQGEPISLILWGPPGTGKTTLARIIARELNAEFIEISAVVSGKKDVVQVIEHAKVNWNLGTKTILFVDEIHRFNKAQQDAFLPHVESGLISLIGATTENPSFEIITPLLSRMRVVTLNPLSKDEMKQVIHRAIEKTQASKRINDEAIDYLAELSDGDARVALGNLDVALLTKKKITKSVIETVSQQRIPGYDKNGDMHYNIISAFIKSMRGSDVDATTYYLARMIQAGEDPKFIARRMVIFASEDIGLAGNGALALAVATFQAVERVGLPEANYNIYHCAVALAKSQKSREISDIMQGAQQLAKTYPNAQVPLHVRNAPTKLMKDLGYGKSYKWKADFKPSQGFLPDEVTSITSEQ
ncbi:MAG: replication-associated recombination protein A [Candidatus Saccharimonadales bacterium]